jgi:hypothetical protein
VTPRRADDGGVRKTNLEKEQTMTSITSLRGRLTALAAMAGGAAWVAVGAIQLTGRDELRTSDIETTLEHVMMGFMAAALLLTVPAVLALARFARSRRPAYVAATGQTLLAVAVTTSNAVGHDPSFFLVAAPLANALWLFGAIGLAMSLRRAGEVSKLVAFGLPAVQVFALPLSVFGGPIVSGAYWLALGYVLSVDGLRRAPAQPIVAAEAVR